MVGRLGTWIAIAVLGALVLTGMAVADQHEAKTQTVSATLTAATAAVRKTATCVGANGTYEITSATYTGTSASADPRLNGLARIRVESVFNTTTKVGWLTGKLSVRGATGGELAEASLAAVNVNGQLNGSLSGRVHRPEAKLLASFSSAFSSAGGLTGGQLGGGSTTGAAIAFGGVCKPKRDSQPPRPSVRLTAEGTIEVLTSTAITVKPLDGSSSVTCSITSLSPQVVGFATGARVEIECATVSNQMVLLKIRREH